MSEEQVAAFQKLYKAHFNKDIDREEACTHGSRLIRFMKLVYQPLTKNEQQRLRERYPKIADYQPMNKKS